MQPREVAVGAGELAELGLLAEPEDAERHQGEQPRREPRRRGGERADERSLRADVGGVGRMEVEHQHSRREGENAVAQPRDPARLAAGQAVVVGLHGATIASLRNRVNRRANVARRA